MIKGAHSIFVIWFIEVASIEVGGLLAYTTDLHPHFISLCQGSSGHCTLLRARNRIGLSALTECLSIDSMLDLEGSWTDQRLRCYPRWEKTFMVLTVLILTVPKPFDVLCTKPR